MNLDDAMRKYKIKKNNCLSKGKVFNLSFDEYCTLISECGITPDDIGRSAGKYVLGRKCSITGIVDGDLPYSIGTCRFIPQEQNRKEMVFTVEMRERISNQVSGSGNPMYGKVGSMTGVECPTKGRFGRNSTTFKGFYTTPNGKFETLHAAAQSHGVSDNMMQNWCKYRNDITIKRPYLNIITKDMVGFTPRDLGYGFEELE